MSAPRILCYNLDKQQKLKLSFICSQLKIICRSVPKADYNQPIGALAGIATRVDGEYEGEGFTDGMLLLVNFTNPLLQALLNALRQNRVSSIPLKAVLTPTNAGWNSLQLHDEILQEHIAMQQNRKQH